MNKKIIIISILLIIVLVTVILFTVNSKKNIEEKESLIAEKVDNNANTTVDMYSINNIDNLEGQTKEIEENDADNKEVSVENNNFTAEDNRDKNIVMTINKDTLTRSGVEILITNNRDVDVYFSPDEYRIEKEVNGEWQRVEPLKPQIYHTISQTCKTNDSCTDKINWKEYYGELEDGTYRILKTQYDANGIEDIWYSEPFEIK